LQEGLLFHALYDREGPDVYIVQTVVSLQGQVDTQELQAAGGALLERHPNLRASFRYEGLNKPVQVIATEVSVPWRNSDLSTLQAAHRDESLLQILAQEYAQRFDLAFPPLLRFHLVRLAVEEYRLIITAHHILFDGWSTPVLIRDLFALYANKGANGSLPRVTPYREYFVWLAAQDREAARWAWKSELAGVETTQVAPFASKLAMLIPEQIDFEVSEAVTQTLMRQARTRGLTLNTITQGAWGILLSRLMGRDDVVFGITVAGRPPEVACVETMVGLFINTVPLRIHLRPGERLAEVLVRLQNKQAQLVSYQHLGLAEIQGLAGVRELFDVAMAYESFPFDPDGLKDVVPNLRVAIVGGRDATHFPLSLVVIPRLRLRFRLRYRPELFEHGAAEKICERLVRILEGMAKNLDEVV
jgi:hypothetical protein